MRKELSDEELLHHREEKNIGRLINMWRRYFETWAIQELEAKGYAHFKMGYMPFIMNVRPEGSTNNEIAERACISKQAISKIVKEMEEMGWVRTSSNQEDLRSVKIHLTQKGQELVIETKRCVLGLTAEYERVIGKVPLSIMMEAIQGIIGYHQQLNKGESLKL